ncbi:MAG: Uma2 family endonuclease [Desulfobacterales bacterium]|nr:Uma2 family endonuclease [Desulfobacterales bacterium]MBF0396680.1 Uma2 family endonuclease [Desulfobacterales bacterium]
MMTSFNHSFVHGRLIRLLGNIDKYEIFPELSIEINGVEHKPDISIYSKKKRIQQKDIIKMVELPLVTIEILSPTQPIQDLIDKFEIYFNAGIKSCWLVIPHAKSIVIYSSLDHYKTYSDDKVIDNLFNIELSIIDIFE